MQGLENLNKPYRGHSQIIHYAFQYMRLLELHRFDMMKLLNSIYLAITQRLFDNLQCYWNIMYFCEQFTTTLGT